MFIPRVLWPNKPMGNPINQVVFWEFAKLGGVKTVGLLGEAYASGGLPFVALEGLLYGIMLCTAGFFEILSRNRFCEAQGLSSTVLRLSPRGPANPMYCNYRPSDPA